MLRNGIEVELVSPSQALDIQNKINSEMYIDVDSKGANDIKVKDNRFEVPDSSPQYGFFVNGENEEWAEKKLTRLDRYNVYESMDETEFIHKGLEVIADDASQKNDSGDVFTLSSDNEKVFGELTNFFGNTINLNTELWSIVYETCKKGDNFYEIIIEMKNKKPSGISRLKYLDPRKIDIKTKNGKLEYYSYNASDSKEGIKLLPWQVLHFKIEDKENAPYGVSLLKSGIRTFSRLSTLEDIMLTYRISRAPERRVFYIDVGNLTPIEAKRFLNKMKDAYKTKPIVDDNGNLNKVSSMMSITSDIFIPVSEGSQGTRIDTLQGGTSMTASGEDPLLKYFRDKILKIMNIPPEFLGEVGTGDKSTSLSQRDAKFGKFIERIQEQIVRPMYKLGSLQLFFKGFKKTDLSEFTIEFTDPSSIKEITEVDVINQKITLMANIKQLEMFPDEWIMKKILKLSRKEINEIRLTLDLEKREKAGEAQITGGAEIGPGGAIAPMQGMPGPEEAPPPLETGEAVPETEVPEEIPAEEGINLDAIVNVVGEKFLIEHSNDMIKLFNYIKEETNNDEENPILESISNFMLQGTSGVKKKKKNKYNLFTYLENQNEFGGINLKEESYSLMEKNEKGEYEEKTKMLKG